MKDYYVWRFSNNRGRAQTINKIKTPRQPYWVFIQIEKSIHRYQLTFSPEVSSIASAYEYTSLRVLQEKGNTDNCIFHFSYMLGHFLRHKSKSRTTLNCKSMIEFVLHHIPSSKDVLYNVKACNAAQKPFSCFILMGENTSETDDEAKFPFYDIIP